MAQVLADRRDVDFVLHEQLKVGELAKHELFAEFNKKTCDLIVSEARNLAVKEVLPLQKLADEEGVTFDNGNVITPDEFKKVYDLFNEGEWLAMPEDPEWGGQGMPRTLTMAAQEYFVAANFAFMMYPGLSHGAAKLVEEFGTDKLKDIFLKKMYQGVWSGTMCLTEPDAGTDVGALAATAVKNDDGTYSISGSKIFISSGEHDLCENIIHPVLARIEGAPEGTKGITLFLVPKLWVNDDGSLGENNDVVCTGIEEKMGIHGNSTCSLTFGGKGECKGYLLGDENKGMKAMFVMMNEARLLVGMQAHGCATASYLYALNYARERVQGKNLLQMFDKDAPNVPIIQHPDVRRMLITMKVYTEGMRSLLYYIANCEDVKVVTDSDDEKARMQGIIDVLIPIAKGYGTDRSFDVTNLGVQVYGGYGYIKEYPVEQLMRDCRITQIYEGTNGLQSMDLLGRKLGLNKGKAIMDLMGAVQQTIASAKENEATKEMAEKVEKSLNKLGEVAMHMGGIAMSPQVLEAFSLSYTFMEVCGDVVMAWMLLWRADVASKALEGAKKKDVAYYEGQLKSADFFTSTILPVTSGKMNVIKATNNAAVTISEDSFGGK